MARRAGSRDLSRGQDRREDRKFGCVVRRSRRRGGRTRDRARGRGYPDRSCGGAAPVATADDAGVSRGLNQSERMERRGEPEPLSRAIVDQGSEIARPKTRAEAEFFADDSEIATKSSARWRPLARIRARERRTGQMMVDVLVFGPWPNAPRAEPRSGVAAEREIFRLAKPWKLTKRGKNLDFARDRSAGGGTLRADAKARCAIGAAHGPGVLDPI